MIKFKQFVNEQVLINEAKGRLDISIKAAGKYLTSQKKKEEFLYNDVLVEHKTDGIKVQALKISSNGDLSDWILAYKGNILYDGEFDFAVDSTIKTQSIGASQFKFVIEHFKSIASNTKSIPVKTELFIEYLMNKPTLSSDYTRKHGMILIGHSISSYTEKNGKLITSPSGFDISKRNKYAEICNLDVPAVLFKGIMGYEKSFEQGIINNHLKDIFQKERRSINWDNIDLLIDDIRSMFLEIESAYGGTEEGVIIKFKDVILKFQQDFQLDQVARREIKLKYQYENPEDETQYWNNVRRTALEIERLIPMKPSSKLSELLKIASKEISNLKLDFEHEKKSKLNILDDIQLTTKTIIMRALKGNNNALVLGKFRVLTKAHYNLIKNGIKKFDGIVVALITSKDTKDTKDLRRKMLEMAFGNKIEIVESTSGNLLTLMNKTNENINWIIAGSDRVDAYRNQLKRSPDIRVFEIPRVDEDISASKVISKIDDEKYFIKNTPKEIHSMYNEIINTFKKGE